MSNELLVFSNVNNVHIYITGSTAKHDGKYSNIISNISDINKEKRAGRRTAWCLREPHVMTVSILMFTGEDGKVYFRL